MKISNQEKKTHTGKTVSKWSDPGPIIRLKDEMSRMFGGFMEDFGIGMFRPERLQRLFEMDSLPRMNVAESDTEIRVTMELPGMTEKDVEVELTGEMLTIKGEKKAETSDEGKNVYRMERATGRFMRSIPAGPGIDRGKAEASMKDGLLTVTLPKTEQARAEVRKLDVKKAA